MEGESSRGAVMATNIEQIFRSFVVSKFREIQEEQEQQQQLGGGKVEGQQNGETVPAEQANTSDDTVTGAGSLQNDQIVQKIEEVLSGALDTELQCKSDKAQLLEIAKANAAAMCAKAGVPLPPSLLPIIAPAKKEEKVTQKSARDTIKELTEKCKKIAQSTDDVIVNKPHDSDEEEEERPFYNHPFKLNEPKPIFFNLNTTPIVKPAPKNQVTLTKEFPVSSGSQHRKKEADSVYGEWVPVEKSKEESKDDVFPKPALAQTVDISTAMNERTMAQKRLTENTFDLEAMCLLNRAQEQIDAWAQSNSLPGQFTGSTGAQILSSDELSNSGPQAWIRKDQFLRAAPVTGGMGAQLMRKMGWREGEGLGKNREGTVEPILVDFKTDRKGLVAVGEKTQKRSGHFSVMKDLSGKHPVSALMEICNKRRWSPPVFVLVDDSGPDHRKHFIFKVMVNGHEYRPSFPSLNKKHAKATAATAALQAMGLVPKESMPNATIFRSASHR
ncbi:protein SON [Terrapene carolina triunguis]|uniref:protein SON n=1 Tax=Terrapene triunguis TaxID=2587831 RepID=UPI00115628B6|nr:protein SON [Terrapene carolina triunguis]